MHRKLKLDNLVIGISSSGNSGKEVRAICYAIEIDAPVIGAVGYSNVKMREFADYSMRVAVDDSRLPRTSR